VAGYLSLKDRFLGTQADSWQGVAAARDVWHSLPIGHVHKSPLRGACLLHYADLILKRGGGHHNTPVSSKQTGTTLPLLRFTRKLKLIRTAGIFKQIERQI